MSQKKIKDNCKYKKEDFHEVSSIVKRVADKTLEQLEKDGVFVFPMLIREVGDLADDQMILRSVNDAYCSGNIMGYLGCGEERLIIASRFSKSEDDYLFQYLLERVLEFPNIVNFEMKAQKENRLFNLMLFLFPRYLKAAMRKGPYKTYIQNEYNDGNLKGTIDVTRHIKNNIPFTGKVAYNQREYSFDNYMMELIRHTIEFINNKSYGHKLLENVKDEICIIRDITVGYDPKDRKKIIEDNKKNTVRHTYYHEYRVLQRLCILILQNEKHQIGLGNRKVFGIVFDGAWLWEEYINQIVKDIFIHPMNKAGTGAQWLFMKEGHYEGKIYPDFIGKNQKNRIVADAKYKPEDNIGNGNKDYFQVLAYMFRFDSKKAYFFYPENEQITKPRLMLNEGLSYEKNVKARNDICLIKHGLFIPSDVENYEDFKEKIKEEEKKFLEAIIN